MKPIEILAYSVILILGFFALVSRGKTVKNTEEDKRTKADTKKKENYTPLYYKIPDNENDEGQNRGYYSYEKFPWETIISNVGKNLTNTDSTGKACNFSDDCMRGEICIGLEDTGSGYCQADIFNDCIYDGVC